MKIISLYIEGLNNSVTPKNIKFNDDINVITGMNGSGKTTILKLLWYCVSGNIERALREIVFTKVYIKTSKYYLRINRSDPVEKGYVGFHLKDMIDGTVLFDGQGPIDGEQYVDEINILTVDLFDTSIFFPTFRRIEGGFSMTGESLNDRHIVSRGNKDVYLRRGGGKIQEALQSHAEMLSVRNHQFISSISTIDIQQLVTKKHSIATASVEKNSKSLSETIVKEIKKYHESGGNKAEALRNAVSTLDKIKQDVVGFDKVREEAFKSLEILSNMIESIFQHKGIKLNSRVILGDISENIDSDFLSAGEKQMLSFLCYNALHTNCPYFIDEPELSLHVDWQRILLDVMMEQGTGNQLFIATHSPFIYSQFEDKEIIIGGDSYGEMNDE